MPHTVTTGEHLGPPIARLPEERERADASSQPEDEIGRLARREPGWSRQRPGVFGLRERSFHSLRHYFCSKLVSCGASVEAVRLLAGHSDLAITQRYVHALGNDLKADIAKLSG